MVPNFRNESQWCTYNVEKSYRRVRALLVPFHCRVAAQRVGGLGGCGTEPDFRSGCRYHPWFAGHLLPSCLFKFWLLALWSGPEGVPGVTNYPPCPPPPYPQTYRPSPTGNTSELASYSGRKSSLVCSRRASAGLGTQWSRCQGHSFLTSACRSFDKTEPGRKH